jgi:hypothetical protein
VSSVVFVLYSGENGTRPIGSVICGMSLWQPRVEDINLPWIYRLTFGCLGHSAGLYPYPFPVADVEIVVKVDRLWCIGRQ